MDAYTDARRFYAERLVRRLQRHYIEQTPLPGQEKTTLSFDMLRRLCQAVVDEGYGEKMLDEL